MGWREALRELTRTKPPETGEKGRGPVSGAKGGGNISTTSSLMTKKPRDRKTLEQYRVIYENGGLFSEAIDVHPLNVLKHGWHLEGEEKQFENVKQKLQEVGFDGLVRIGVIDALVFGDGFQEIEPTMGGDLYDVHPRAPECFEPKWDDRGVIQKYEFYKSGGSGYNQRPDAVLEPKDIIHIVLFPSSARPIGEPLTKRVFDDLKRDTTIAEGVTNAGKRHGFPKDHVKAGKDGDEPTPQGVIDHLAKEFQDMDSKTEYVTNQYVDIKQIDTNGLVGIEALNNFSLPRLSAATGVPMESLGLRQGTTDATAVSRQAAFNERIKTFQKILADVYNTQLIDKITGKPGSVWLVFNPADRPSVMEVVDKYAKFSQMDSLRGDLYVRLCFEELEMDTGPLDEYEEKTTVEVPVPDPMLDPAFQAQQEKMKQPAKVADGEDDND